MSWTLITGGAKKLGAEICRTLASCGYPILVHYNNSYKEALSVAESCRSFGVRAEIIKGDFSSIEGVEAFVQQLLNEFKPVTALINNVGNYLIASSMKTTPAEWRGLFQTNLYAPFAIIHALSEQIIQSRGSIINIGVAGLSASKADTYSTAYTLTKAALLGLTKSLAKELAPSLVRVNMVSPGILEESLDHAAIPMHRSATFHEVARVVAFLLDKENSYITGQNIEVAGGIRL